MPVRVPTCTVSAQVAIASRTGRRLSPRSVSSYSTRSGTSANTVSGTVAVANIRRSPVHLAEAFSDCLGRRVTYEPRLPNSLAQ